MRDIKVVSLEIAAEEYFNKYGSLKIDHAVEVIEETLELNHNDVISIRRFGFNPKRIDIGLKSQAFNTIVVQQCLGETVRISSGHVVSVNMPNNWISDVYVKGAPLEWSEYRYKRIFSYYGDVKKINYMSLKENDTSKKEYLAKENGIVKIRMKIRKAIPSSMTIEQERIEVYYRGQTRTCWTCGRGH